MPGFDGSGPLSQGPITGRGMGICKGARPSSGYRRFGRMGAFGPGRGRGRGRGFGFRAYSYPPGNEPTEMNKAFLEEKVAYLEDELKVLRADIADMNEQNIQEPGQDME